MSGPLCIDATVVGSVIELRYASHIEAFEQLYKLRRALESNVQMLDALKSMLHDDDHDQACIKARPRSIRQAAKAKRDPYFDPPEWWAQWWADQELSEQGMDDFAEQYQREQIATARSEEQNRRKS